MPNALLMPPVDLLTTPPTPFIRASSGLGVALFADIRTKVVKIRAPAVPILWKLAASAPSRFAIAVVVYCGRVMGMD